MNLEIWQKLLSLESHDIVKKWFRRIHSRELNARRASEINAATKQAREYFKNANTANYSVRPLLTFYGVSCLSRALLLLIKVHGGEEGLKPSHGLETVGWTDTMSGDLANGLSNLDGLRIRTCAGLFTEFVTHTGNYLAMHVNSSTVDWRIQYDVPQKGQELTFMDLLVRLPDMGAELNNLGIELKFAYINDMSYSEEAGFKGRVSEKMFLTFKDVYKGYGYRTKTEGKSCILTCDADTFKQHKPLFTHSYINKISGLIPGLNIAEPFAGGTYYSQICVTYIVSYILGMLVRYYPTNWVALTQGGKGDGMWPAIHRAQSLVESSYPELVMDMISDILTQSILQPTSQQNATDA